MKKDNKRLSEFKEKYQKALTSYSGNRNKFNKRWEQYKGTKKIEGKNGQAARDADVVYNFTMELIESQIDSYIPPPKVKPKKTNDRTMNNASVIEDMIRNEIDRLPMEYLNDEDERSTKVMGGDMFLVEWDNSASTHDTVGALSIRLINAKEFIPQNGVKSLQYMNYLFIRLEDTKESIEKRYDKDVSLESVDGNTEDTSDKEDMVTQIICYYINKDRLGCFSWAGDTVLIDDDNYEARKDKVCSKCGKTKSPSQKECICGSTEFEKRPLDYEVLTEDIIRADGTIIPAMSYARDENGYLLEDYQEQEIDPQFGMPMYDRVFDENMTLIGEEPRMTTKQRPYLVPTQIPYYTPKKFPICIRKNVSVYNEVLGDSDCDPIADFQTSANKILSKVDKKTISAGSVLTIPEGINYSPTDADVKPILITNVAQMQMLKSITLDYNTQKDLDTVMQYYQMAKSTLGISDTYQGKQDVTAQSGRAKELQIAQAAGRQKSKRVMKNACYADIYETMFKFMLAYADEPRVYASTDQNGKPIEKVFSRYDFLSQDDYGNWYYDDEYLFSVDESGTGLSDRGFLLDDVRQDFGMGAFGNVASPETLLLYWKEKEVLNYPNAKRMVSHWEGRVTEAKQQAAMQAQLVPQGGNNEVPQLQQ